MKIASRGTDLAAGLAPRERWFREPAFARGKPSRLNNGAYLHRSYHMSITPRMSDHATLLADFRRLADGIRARLAAPASFEAAVEDAMSVQIERGIVYRDAVLREAVRNELVERLIELSNSDRLATTVVVDSSGHHRPVYRAMLVFAWLSAYQLYYETLPRTEFGRWEEGLRPWCDLLEAELTQIAWPAGPMPAGRGSSAAEAAWMALALHVAGKIYIRDAWKDLAADTFGKITRAQAASGAFLTATGSDNPETHWYHELVILHAAASYAVRAEDRIVASAVARNTLFHLNETQPDHATTQPWALFAFAWNNATRILADDLLHNATVLAQSAAQASGVSLILLADALYCLNLFLERKR
jgi:hypothetical protein